MNMRIAGLTICVNYADFLERTLPAWAAGLDETLVVTTPTDQATLQLCARQGVRVHATDVFFACGASFNKGGALDEGVTLLAPADWLLIFDADCLPPASWRDQLEAAPPIPGHIYGGQRTDEDGTPLSNWGLLLGFLQLFHMTDPAVQDRPLFGDWSSAAAYDLVFAERWPKEQWRRVPFTVMHFGETHVHWCGRGNTAGMAQLQADRKQRGWQHERLRRG
jgi:hypothetical protein